MKSENSILYIKFNIKKKTTKWHPYSSGDLKAYPVTIVGEEHPVVEFDFFAILVPLHVGGWASLHRHGQDKGLSFVGAGVLES